jgi:hypothetical protein
MNTPSLALLSALLLNNEGVVLLLQNRDKEAIPYFSKSLALMQTTLTNSTSAATESATKPRLSVYHAATHPLPNFRRDNDQSFLLYTEAFTFSSELDDSRLENNASIIFSAVVIFNIALAYHKQAKLLGRQQVCFAKAEKMYVMVGRLLHSDSVNFYGTALRVKLSALNNLSLIQYEQSNFESSHKGFQHLAWAIESATSTALSSSQMDVEGMLLNVLFASAPNIAPAA